jgi:hypothetical protein
MDEKFNILIISHYFPPLNSIASNRPYSWAKYWYELGHDVIVLTTKKDIYDDRLEVNCDFEVKEIDYFGSKLISEKKANSENVNNIKLKNGFKSSLLNKITSLVYFFRKRFGILAAERIPESIYFWTSRAVDEAIKINKEKKIDFVISTYASPSAHIIAYKIKKIIPTIKWVSDYRDSWTISNYSQPGFPIFRIYEKYIEKKIISFADLITTVSPSLVKEFEDRFPKKIVKLIENGFFPEEKYIKKITMEDEINIVYTGSFGGYRSVKFIDDFLKRLEIDDAKLYNKVHFYILGNGNEYFHNKKISFLGKVSHDVSLSYQNSADILFLIESDKEIAKGTLTGKFFEYLKTGKYIIAFGPKEHFDISKYLEDSKSGCVSKIDYISVYKAIYNFNNSKKIELSSIDKFNRKSLSIKLLKHMKKIINTNKINRL